MKVKVLHDGARCIDATRESGFDVPDIVERSIPKHVNGNLSFHRLGSSGEPTACALDGCVSAKRSCVRHNMRSYFMFFLLGGA